MEREIYIERDHFIERNQIGRPNGLQHIIEVWSLHWHSWIFAFGNTTKTPIERLVFEFELDFWFELELLRKLVANRERQRRLTSEKQQTALFHCQCLAYCPRTNMWTGPIKIAKHDSISQNKHAYLNLCKITFGHHKFTYCIQFLLFFLSWFPVLLINKKSWNLPVWMCKVAIIITSFTY